MSSVFEPTALYVIAVIFFATLIRSTFGFGEAHDRECYCARSGQQIVKIGIQGDDNRLLSPGRELLKRQLRLIQYRPRAVPKCVSPIDALPSRPAALDPKAIAYGRLQFVSMSILLPSRYLLG